MRRAALVSRWRPAFIALLMASAEALASCGGVVFVRTSWPAPVAARRVDPAWPAWRASSDVPHVSVFYDALAPYGVWEESPSFGWIWTPSEEGFVPYARGRWVDTEAGPTFLADEPWGWAAAHYGRWFLRARDARWYWVPGTRWGPAWVAWRVAREHVGWCALPPEGWSRTSPDEGYAGWQFVPAEDFLGPSVTGRTYGARDVPWLMATSRPHAGESGDSGWVVGPEVRSAGARAGKLRLGGLRQSEVRWVPRWERGELRRARPSHRVGPAAPERRARKALTDSGRSESE